jgi:serine protease Do
MKLNIDRILSPKTLAAVCFLIALAGLSTAFAGKSPAAREEEPSSKRPAAESPRSPSGYSSVVKRVLPSVVKVSTTIRTKPAAYGRQDPGDGPFRWFFGPQFGQRGPIERFTPEPQRGLGSGVVITKDGYILTNHHVIDGADEVKVTLSDGREMQAKVVGTDPQTDVAVIKVDARSLAAIEVADSEQIEVGEVVLAIGNPFGLGQTVTSGIVSGKGRGNIGLDYEDFIQTDAAINPGNSGGALVDADGRLVGINTAILSRSGGSQGIGFAIPANLAQGVMDALIKEGRVTRGYMGAMIQDVTPSLAKEFKIKQGSGALVGEVKSGGPADRAGVQAGDVITEIDGHPVRDSRSLRLRVAGTKPGTTLALKVVRDGEAKTLDVKVKELPGAATLAKNSDPAQDDEGVLNGVTVADLDENSRRQNELPRGLKGVVVAQIDPNSPAAEAGLRTGDIIQEINRRPVRNADEAVRLTEKSGDRTTLLRVWNNGGSRFVVVDESKAG